MAFFVSETEEGESPWPRLGDKLLWVGPNVRGAAYLAGIEAEGNSAIAEGYLRAADLLAGTWLRGEAGRATSCAAAAVSLPIISLYRHGLEMTMKAILSDNSDLDEVGIAGFGHNLSALWTECRRIVWPYAEAPGDDVLAVEQAILDFHDFDPKNEKARYSFDRRGTAIVLRESSVDIAHLRDRMRAVSNFFDCVDSELHVRAFGF